MSHSSDTFLIFTILICIILSAFFSSSETALLSINKYKLRTAVDQKKLGAASAYKLLGHPEKLITMLLICNNIVNILASALATVVGQNISGEIGIAIATGILTFLLLMFAEIIPKTLASKFPDQVSFAFSPILVVLEKIVFPIVWIFNFMTRLFFRLFRIESNTSHNQSLSANELRVIVKESQQLIGKDHSDMLSAILDLEQLTVNDIMIPRSEIGAIDIEDDIKTIMRQINQSRSGRLVVYRNTLEEKIVGTLRIRECYRLMLDNNEITKEQIIRATDEPLYVLEGTTLTRQLLNFKRSKRKIGIVVDEYGYCIGVITIEDILEEIVGNFTLNSVIEEKEDINQISNGKYVIDGQANLRDLNKKFQWGLYCDEARTLNGFLVEHFEEIPEVGKKYYHNQLEMTVLKADKKKIYQVEVLDHSKLTGENSSTAS